MTNALNQGILVQGNVTLNASTRALGPNTYLSRREFFLMLGAAFVVHALVVGVMAIWPNQGVKNIPVRALSFKLGNADRMVTGRAPTALPAPPVVPPSPKPEPKPVTQVTKKPATPKPAAAPPAIAASPQQYVREVGAAPKPAAGDDPSMNEQLIRARYEQEISAWIQRHKLYPVEAGGREGRVVVRVRIDRGGNVRYYAIEQSSGLQALDDGALDMIRRANPMPAVPDGYPAGNLAEFLIPITFRAPQ